MRKLVNGKVVDIDNIELFELAQEGIAIQNSTTSSTADVFSVDTQTQMVRNIVHIYDVFYKSLPYPLYAIERDIKYAAVATLIKMSLKNIRLRMWVNKGLYIVINESNMECIHVLNRTWSIKHVGNIEKDNTDIDTYSGEAGYKEFKWAIDCIVNKSTNSNFYAKFMPKFISACNNNQMVIKWELENILTFSNVPQEVTIKENTLIDTENAMEYTMDIFENGYTEVESNVQSIRFGNNFNVNNNRKRIKTYIHDTYCKSVGRVDSSCDIKSTRIKKTEKAGIEALFMTICGIKSSGAMLEFPTYRGYIVGNELVFEVQGDIYRAKINKYIEPELIASQSKLYSVKANNIYFIRKVEVSRNIYKVGVYSYNLKDRKVRLCKISYTYK